MHLYLALRCNHEQEANILSTDNSACYFFCFTQVRLSAAAADELATCALPSHGPPYLHLRSTHCGLQRARAAIKNVTGRSALYTGRSKCDRRSGKSRGERESGARQICHDSERISSIGEKYIGPAPASARRPTRPGIAHVGKEGCS